MKITYVSLCSGYGAECIAFKRLRRDYPDFNFECLAWSEIEPSACKAHDAIHEEYRGRNLGDLTKVDWKAWHESIGSPHIDLLFASTPCQSVSNAGKNAGMKKGTDAESALIWATESCIRALNPDIIMYENVKGMVSKRNRPDFDEWCATLESLGYVVQWKILNSKDFGVAQNRERVFPIAIRKDLPMAGHYNYPQGLPLTKCVEDYMEPAEEIGEEYFISQDRVTDKVLSDILDQPNVRAEMKKLYHEEWSKTQSAKPTYHFVSLEWLRREDCWENLGDHFQVYKTTFSTDKGLREEEIKVNIWYHTPDMYREDIRKAIQRLTYGGVDNLKELENAIYQDLVTNPH